MLASALVISRGVKLTAVALAATAAIAALTWKMACGDCLHEVATASRAVMPSLLAAGSDAAPRDPAAVVPPDSGSLRPIAQVEDALFVKGSLRGTDYPGWGTARGEPVKPNRALRDRFDYYLLALDEASLAELSALVQTHAERDLGAEAAREIRAVWDHYLQLQQHQFTHAANPADPGSMQTAMQEHQQVRQLLLGVHWAQAFYGDEEKTLAHEIKQTQDGVPPKVDADRALFQPPPGTEPQALHQQRTERFGAEAAQRLRVLDEEDARWDQRLARARADIEIIRRDAAYSATQRDQAIARYLGAAYPDASERLRAGGLLGM